MLTLSVMPMLTRAYMWSSGVRRSEAGGIGAQHGIVEGALGAATSAHPPACFLPVWIYG